MASLDIWIDGAWGDETINWHMSNVHFDLNRYQWDENYAQLVNQHMERALEYLGKELGQIAVSTPFPDEPDWTNCE